MSSNLENDGLVGLRNDDLDRDGLTMVVDNDNYEMMFEGKMYHSYDDYVKAKRSRTADIFANSPRRCGHASAAAPTKVKSQDSQQRHQSCRDDAILLPGVSSCRHHRRVVVNDDE